LAGRAAEILVGGHPDPSMVLPLRLGGLKRRWTVAVQQLEGWVNAIEKNQTSGESVLYSELGIDAQNYSAVPVYVGRAPRTHLRIGHPVVAAGRDAEQIFVQVTKLHLAAGKFMFHVALNNPLERSVDVDVWPSFPDVRLVRQHVTLGPGEHRVLV